MTKAVTEQELAEKAVAPRVTKADIDALKERITYTTEQCPGGTTSTFVHAFLGGKFFLATGFSACVNAENFDADIGERLARSNAEKQAENKLWELEGYRLFAGTSQPKNHIERMTEEKNGCLSFSAALEALKGGKKVARSGWNGKDQYVVAQAQATKTEASKIWNPHNKAHAEKIGGQIDVAPYCTLKTAQDTLAMGWVPSTGDLFAEDWVIL